LPPSCSWARAANAEEKPGLTVSGGVGVPPVLVAELAVWLHENVTLTASGGITPLIPFPFYCLQGNVGISARLGPGRGAPRHAFIFEMRAGYGIFGALCTENCTPAEPGPFAAVGIGYGFLRRRLDVRVTIGALTGGDGVFPVGQVLVRRSF
jgi:hypothetical protein